MYPEKGALAKEKGCRVQRIGPITGWSIDYASTGPQVPPALTCV